MLVLSWIGLGDACSYRPVAVEIDGEAGNRESGKVAVPKEYLETEIDGGRLTAADAIAASRAAATAELASHILSLRLSRRWRSA